MTVMDARTDTRARRTGLLYPMLVIAAIASVALSIVGMASLMGWLPVPLQASPPASTSIESRAHTGHHGERHRRERPRAALQCAECSIVESIRDLEQAPHGERRAPAVSLRAGGS
jgi:hypothetical protein